MVEFSETLGPLTPAMKTKWKHYSRFFDDDGRRIERSFQDRMMYRKKNEEEDEGDNVGEGEEDDEGDDDDGFGEDDEGDDDDEGDEDDESDEYDESIDMAAIQAQVAADLANPPTESKALPRRPKPVSRRLENMFDCYKPSAMSAKEGDAVKSLLRRIFQYEPEKRPRAAELLNDPWFAAPEHVVAEPDTHVLPREMGKAKRKRSSEKYLRGERP
jgi:serine/threonine protein kinase